MIFGLDESGQTHTEHRSKDVFRHFAMQTIGDKRFGQTIRHRVRIHPYGLDHQMAKGVQKPRDSNPNPKRFVNISNCRSSGALVLFSQERTTAVAMPILVAKWYRVRFFSRRLTRIQSPIVFMLVGDDVCHFLGFWLNFI